MFPQFAGALVVEGNRALCRLPDRQVVVSAPRRLLADLVHRCDGRTSREDIVRTLGGAWDAVELDSLIDSLVERGVLCDVRELAGRWWAYVKNPRPTELAADLDGVAAPPVATLRDITEKHPQAHYWPVSGSPLTALLGRRESLRTYAERPIPRDIVLRLLWAAYGARSHRTVPSAGAIYPLKIDYVNLRATGDLPAGVYRVSYLDDGTVGLRMANGDVVGAWRAWSDPDALTYAQGIVVVSGGFDTMAATYDNRAALLVPLEAGHVAQNVLLCATESELAAVESCDFVEDRLGEFLGCERGVVPLTSVIFGGMPSQGERVAAEQASAVEFDWVDVAAPLYGVPFSVAAARPRGSSNIDWCWGRSTDPREARSAAIAEAYERLGCASPSGVYRAAACDLPRFVDPRSVVAYNEAQYARPEFPFVPFDAQAALLWKDGRNVFTGDAATVLADHVYFPWALEPHRPYTTVSSSGAAAYTTQEGALERALLELIERDAFMTTWVGRLSRPAIDPASVPHAIAARLTRLAGAGVDVVAKDLDSDLAPSILVVGRSLHHGFTRVTAASDYEPERALDRALGELEMVVAARLGGGTPDPIEPAAVVTPRDHGRLYSQRKYNRRADFLLSKATGVRLTEIGRQEPKNWPELSSRLAGRYPQLIWIDLTPKGATLAQGRLPLIVGRAIVPGLIPISFGAGREPVDSFLAWSTANGRRVRSGRFAKPLFPHPFS